MTRRRLFGKKRLAFAGWSGALMVVLVAGAAQAREVLGVPLPNGAAEIGENRFRSPLGLRATVEWMERQLRRSGRRVRFEPIIDLPDVVAVHTGSPSDRTRWEGINVSEYGGAVAIFIIERR